MATQNEKTTVLPGLLSTVAAGFDVVTSHLWLVVFPITLDLFYWLGPQLRTSELLLSLASLFREVGALTEVADQLADVAGRTNLFTVLSVPFLGIPGLVAGIVMPERTPLQPLVWEIRSPGSLLLLFVAISFLGLLASTIFHAFVARAVCNRSLDECQMFETPGQSPWLSVLRRLPIYYLRVLALTLLLLLIVLALYIPLVLVAAVSTLISAVIGSLVMLGGLLMIVWVIFYLSFGLHGVLLRERPVFLAVLDSMRLVQRNWLPALTLFLLIIAARNLLSWIWLVVDAGSWLTLVNIAGYAFVNTGLIAATFIFFRDRIRLQEQGFINE